MSYIALFFGYLLLFVINWEKNYILPVFLLTVLSKIILLPISLWTQKTALKW